ncbi:GCN5 family N-acetyltransferase [Pseudonocardia sulfidoxydans NBRC 16205]|uniref:GCN5 family N-acetyltransferase n=1 Tax=Pseudonocardia sulfidoxydans NBRC 16205 TaxID=1223511 RepID=A0A511DKP1_9PSEU|nr:GNAT family N-acetyltransferase [Pseudonocardia sulfidoxydans]GEL23618.1 GCN5 family N-acetyltransferase [Pseudonocardia sulfidoxydans NBRC 16205]
MSEHSVRPARPADVEQLIAIENAAGERFREIGMSFVADDPAPSTDEMLRFVVAGVVRVVDIDGRVAGYLQSEVVDDCAHIEQVSVDPVHIGLRVGRALLDDNSERALAAGLSAVTLTTYVDVPWNGPYYRRRGFRVLTDDEITPGLAALRAEETRRGLDRRPRCCMRLDLREVRL